MTVGAGSKKVRAGHLASATAMTPASARLPSMSQGETCTPLLLLLPLQSSV
jgi:hypothetical protein